MNIQRKGWKGVHRCLSCRERLRYSGVKTPRKCTECIHAQRSLHRVHVHAPSPLCIAGVITRSSSSPKATKRAYSAMRIPPTARFRWNFEKTIMPRNRKRMPKRMGTYISIPPVSTAMKLPGR
mmetsp:Transcript_30610/g.79902  ORF Transcript_30610/g.79902 Transcript_30610/m.79902 type:complete len:123 (-) Transcript_30610:1819-2187(-)